MEETVYIREGTTSRVTAANRPYGKVYDFYSVSLETFGSTHVCLHGTDRDSLYLYISVRKYFISLNELFRH